MSCDCDNEAKKNLNTRSKAPSHSGDTCPTTTMVFAAIVTALVVLSFVFFLTLFFAEPAASADFYQWMNEQGTLEATDDPKQIPTKYAGEAEERSWAELFEKTDSRFTPVVVPATPAPVVVPTSPDMPQGMLEADEGDCDQPIRALPPKLVQSGDYSRFVYPYTDECGNVVAEMNSSPRVVLNR